MRVPLSLDPRCVDRYRARDKTGAIISDAAIDSVGAAMKSAHELAHQIAAASDSIMQDVTQTPEANGLRVKRTALQLAERATKALDQAHARALAEVDKINRGMAIKAPKDAAEMRAVLRAMTPGQRRKALADDVFAAAALSSHPMLSGLSSTEHALIQDKYQRQHYPDQVDRRTRLTRTIEDLERGGSALVTFVNEITARPAVKLAEAAEQRAKAAEAAAAAE